MIQLILAGLGFSIWTIYVIITYYSRNYSSIDHLETATGYEWYLFAIIILYGLYKVYTLFFSWKRIVKYNFLNISLFAILHLLVVCIAYTSLQQGQLSSFFAWIPPSSMVLFSHSIGLLIYPVILVIILRALGSTILWLTIENWTSEKLRFRFPIELTTGFFT